jgi:neutral ceramidase
MQLNIGLGKQEITSFIDGIGMMGYGQFHNVVREVATSLWARVLFIKNSDCPFILVHLEQAFVTMAIRDEVLKRARVLYPEMNLNYENLAITAQHTHSAPGGYSHYPFYNFTIPGFQKQVFERVVSGIMDAIKEAGQKTEVVTLEWGETLIPEDKEVAFNRSMSAHIRNPEASFHQEEEKHLAIDRTMTGLFFKSKEDKILAVLNWFGVHGTSISSFNTRIHHDNKGVAARLYEENHPGTVAFFLQASAGDVSPNFIWDKKIRRMRGKYADQYENAEYNGEIQFRESEKIQGTHHCVGDIQSGHAFIDVTKTAAAAAHGVAFFTGTLEGPGIAPFLGKILARVSDKIKEHHISKDPIGQMRFYKEHGTKKIILDHRTGSFLGIPLHVWKKLPPLPERTLEAVRKSAKAEAINTLPWIPPVLPFQILKLGNLVVAFIPGEITVMAGRRLKKQLLEELQCQEVILTSYANAYMGYITTPEEYDQQCYEGGHTVYGRNTFKAIGHGFSFLAKKMKGHKVVDLGTIPFRFPEEELDRRSV